MDLARAMQEGEPQWLPEAPLATRLGELRITAPTVRLLADESKSMSRLLEGILSVSGFRTATVC